MPYTAEIDWRYIIIIVITAIITITIIIIIKLAYLIIIIITINVKPGLTICSNHTEALLSHLSSSAI